MTRGWRTFGRSTHDRRRKKTRSQRQQGEPGRQRQQVAPVKQPVQERSEAARPAASGSGWRAPTRSSVAQTIRPEDYGYVYSDLRRIAVLAGSIFLVLIALSFIVK